MLYASCAPTLFWALVVPLVAARVHELKIFDTPLIGSVKPNMYELKFMLGSKMIAPCPPPQELMSIVGLPIVVYETPCTLMAPPLF